MRNYIVGLLLLGILYSCTSDKEIELETDYAQYVNPFIGNAGAIVQGLTIMTMRFLVLLKII